jgi:hypothetical protein
MDLPSPHSHKAARAACLGQEAQRKHHHLAGAGHRCGGSVEHAVALSWKLVGPLIAALILRSQMLLSWSYSRLYSVHIIYFM